MSKVLRPPQGIYATIEDWRNSITEQSRSNYIDFGMIDPPITAQPKSIYDKVHWKFIEENKHSSSPAFLAVLNNARVFNGNIITEDNHLLFELSLEYGKKPEEHSIFNIKKLPKPQKHPGIAAVLTFHYSHCYYHWMFDVLPRLYLLELGSAQYNKVVINNQANRKFQNETLGLLGIQPHILFSWSKGKDLHLQANKIIVPSLPGYRGRMPKWACKYLRDRFLPYTNEIKGYERLFISRERAGHRRLLNEDQVLEVLSKYGFKKVVLEQMSILEQINLLASAEAIVAPHGSGLTNCVFCSPNTKIIEFFSPNYVNPLYWRLSSYLNLDYYYIIGEGESPPDYVDPLRDPENITMSVEKLMETLSLADL